MRFIARGAWQARQPRYRTAFTAEFGSTVHYEGPRMGTFPHASCAAKVRGIQNFHMDARGWADVAYTAIVCPHGFVFEGRWIGARTGANGTNQGNDSAYAICALVGQGDPTPDVMVDAIAEVAAHLRAHGGAGIRVNGHRDWKATACPGDPLYHEVRAGTFTKSTPTVPTQPTTPKGPLMALSDEEQEQLLSQTNANHLMLTQLQEILLGDDAEGKGDSLERLLASAKRVEGELAKVPKKAPATAKKAASGDAQAKAASTPKADAAGTPPTE